MNPTPEQFRYTLYFGDIANILINSPDGWMKTTVEYNRSDTYGALVRALTLPYTFDKDNATLCRRIYYSQNSQARARFYIDKLNHVNWTYDRIFTGKFDFSSKKDTRTGFEVSAIEDNFTAKLDAYEDVQFALPLVGDDVKTITLTPLILREKADFIYNPSSDNRADAFFILNIVNNTQLATQASVQNSGFQAVTNPDFNSSNQWFYVARADGTVQLTMHLEGSVATNTAADYEINFYKSNGTSAGELVKTVYHVSLGAFGNADFAFDANFAVPMAKGERLYCYFRNVSDSDSNHGFRITVGSLSATYNTQSPASPCKGLMASDVYKRLVQQVSPGQVSPSTMLSGEFSRLFYTCSNAILTTQVGNVYNAGDDLQTGGTYLVIGAAITYVNELGVSQVYNVGDYFTSIVGYDQFTSVDGGIAQLQLETPAILISFKQFFQDFYGMKCGQVAFGLDNNTAALEDLTYFYRPVTTLDCGSDITGWESTPNVKRFYTSIKIGQDDKQYNALNGSQEVQSTQNYTTPYENTKNELNAITYSRCDPFGIEEIRAITPNVNGNTAASRSDNDVWRIMLHPIEMRPYTVAEGTMSYTGVDGSYYNWQITPKRNLLRGAGFLASCLYNMTGVIAFKSGEKNTTMITVDMDGVRVAEREDVVISSLDAPIFKPELFTFTAALPGNIGSPLMTNPYGRVKHVFDGIPLSGFITDVSVDEAESTAQKFQLECSGDVDLMTLIR